MLSENDFRVQFETAIRHKQTGNFTAAEALLHALQTERPHDPVLLFHIGDCGFYLKKYRPAEVAFREAIVRLPDPGIFCALGHTLLISGDRSGAERAFREAAGRNPALPQTYFNNGRQYMQRGRPDLAIPTFTALTCMVPEHPTAFLLLGSAQMQCEKIEDAIASYRSHLAHHPKSIDGLRALGNATHAAGHPTEAIDIFRQALRLAPEDAAAHFGIATSLQLLGNFEDAEAEIRQALAITPERPFYWNALVRTKKYRNPEDPDISAIQQLADHAEKFPGAEAPRLFFMLGKIYQDLGRDTDAFAAWQRANQMMSALLRYDPAEDIETLSYVASLFTADYLAEHQGGGVATDLPIFIVGMPRSGSSLVEQILASHTDVFGAGELADFTNCYAEQVCGGPPEFDANKYTPDAMHRLGHAYLTGLKARAPGAKRIIDKMPGNFPFAGLITMAMPGARILHVRRDPLDCCLSCYATQFLEGHPYSYDLEGLGRYYLACQKLMAHWKKVLPEDRFMEVNYEDLVQDFEPQLRRLLAFCGLEWQESCRNFYQTRRQVRTASLAQVRQPLNTQGIGRWRHYEAGLAPLIRVLNSQP